MVHPFVLTVCLSSVVASCFMYANPAYAIFVLMMGGSLILYKAFQSRWPIVAIITFGCLGCVIWVLVTEKSENADANYAADFLFKDKEKVNLIVRVDEFPNYRFTNNQYVFADHETGARILTNVPPHVKFGYLDSIELKGTVRDIRSEDKQWHSYYRKLGVHYTMFLPQVQRLGSIENMTISQTVMHKLFAIKMSIRKRVIEEHSSHASALVLGMLLGERDELSKDEKDMFNAAGLSHILVVSGYNISLLISFVFVMLKPISRSVRVLTALIFIVLFVLLVGAEASVVRAALMGSIIIFAKVARRPGSALNVLLLVSSIMLISNPHSILDVGLHLSFIATFALLVMPNFKKMPEFLSVTLWVFVFVSPYILYLSGYVSLGTIIANVCVTTFLPAFMMLSLVSVLFTYIHICVGLDVAIVDMLSRYIFIVARLCQGFGSLKMNIPPSLVTAGYSALFISILFMKNRLSTEEFIERRYQIPARQRSSLPGS